jgi:ElaB/YqjD/DUF883 family membrane-anchored ribosome-binding protein
MEMIMTRAAYQTGTLADDTHGRVETLKQDAQAVLRDASSAAQSATKVAGEFARDVNERLKAVGVDTDVMADAVKSRSDDLQRLIADELSTRPVRTLAVAAALGLAVGFLTTRR